MLVQFWGGAFNDRFRIHSRHSNHPVSDATAA